MNERDKEIREMAWVLVSDEERERNELYETRERWERCDQKFADLIRADAMEAATRAANVSWSLVCKKMVELEREACAKVCDEAIKKERKLLSSEENNLGNFFVQHRITAHMNDARQIRARKNT